MNIRLLTLLLALCMVAPCTMAQRRGEKATQANTTATQSEPKVLSMQVATNSFIAADDQRKDNNGDICALVKVQVLDDFTEESSSIGDVVNRGPEKWVYIYKGAKRMKLFFKNNLPLTVTFSDYGIQSVESNRVYELKIQVPNVPDKPDVPDGTLRISVTPSTAEVTLWGDNLPRQTYRAKADGMLTLTLPWGRYYYVATADGYNQAEGSVFVNDEGTVQHIDLAGQVGTLTMACPTDKADLYIDNRLLGTFKKKKALTYQLRPGNHTLTVSRKGYISHTRQVTVNRGQSQTFELPALESEYNAKKKAWREEKEARKAAKKAKKAEADEAKRIAKQQKEQAKVKKKEALTKKLAAKEKQTVVLGLTAGYSMASASFKDGDTKSLSSFHAGLTADFRLSNNLYLNSGVIYNNKGYNYEHNYVSEEATPQYIDIPVQLSVRIPLSTTLKLELCAGPYAAFCIGGKVTDKYYYSVYDESFSSAYNGFDYGLQAGAGLIIQHHIRLSVGYQLGMGSDYQNRCLMAGVSYRF